MLERGEEEYRKNYVPDDVGRNLELNRLYIFVAYKYKWFIHLLLLLITSILFEYSMEK